MSIHKLSHHLLYSGSWSKCWKARALDSKLFGGREPVLLIFVLLGLVWHLGEKMDFYKCFEEMNEFRKEIGVIIDHHGTSY